MLETNMADAHDSDDEKKRRLIKVLNERTQEFAQELTKLDINQLRENFDKAVTAVEVSRLYYHMAAAMLRKKGVTVENFLQETPDEAVWKKSATRSPNPRAKKKPAKEKLTARQKFTNKMTKLGISEADAGKMYDATKGTR